MIEKLTLNIKEAAEVTGVTEGTLRWHRHRGTGPKSFKLGRRVAYRMEDLRAWIDEQSEVSGTRGGAA
jgi:predicted DNA-binding transcriptional regulator AlpA